MKAQGNLPPFETLVKPLADPPPTSSMRERTSASTIPIGEKQSSGNEIKEKDVPTAVEDGTSNVEPPHIDVLVGDTQFTSQYVVLYSGSRRTVGLALNGDAIIS